VANLLIGYSDIGFNSTAISTPTLDIGQARNLYAGSRVEAVRIQTASTTSVWSWDHGSTITPEFIFLARADLLRRADSAASTWTVDGSTSNTFGTVDTKTGTFNLSDLKGPRSEDLLSTFTYSSGYRYWRFTATTTASFKHTYSKLFLGAWLDLGRDPLYPARMRRESKAAMPRAVPWSFELEWRGITDATLTTLSDRVLKYKDVNPVILYDPADIVLVGSIRVLHAFVTDVEIAPEWPGVNRLRMSFTEAI
jgi:hypothetical protein